MGIENWSYKTSRAGLPLKRSVSTKLTDREKYVVTLHIDTARERIDGKMTVAEVAAEASVKCRVPVTKHIARGILVDLGIKPRRAGGGPRGGAARSGRLADLETRVSRLEAAVGLPAGPSPAEAS